MSGTAQTDIAGRGTRAWPAAPHVKVLEVWDFEIKLNLFPPFILNLIANIFFEYIAY